jgi:hypothetical protein
VSAYRVSRVLGADPFQSKYGEKINYKIELEGEGQVELVRNPSSPAPQPGDVLRGHIEGTGWGRRLKLEYNRQDGAPSTSAPSAAPRSGDSGRQWTRDPSERRAITRAHAQQMALRYAAIQAERGKLPDSFSLEQLWAVVDAFEQDVRKASEAA